MRELLEANHLRTRKKEQCIISFILDTALLSLLLLRIKKRREKKMSESESEKSRASDLDGAGPSTPPPRTHVLRGEAAERDHVQQGGRLPRGYPMPQGIEGPPPPELAVSGSNAVRGRPASKSSVHLFKNSLLTCC